VNAVVSAQPAAWGSPRRDLFELALGYALILSVIWTERPAQRILYCITVVTLVAVTLLRRDSLKTLGLGGEGFLRSLWVPALAAALAGVAMFAAWRLHTLHLHFGRPVFHFGLNFRFTGYAIWAMLQQFLLQDYFLLRLLRLVNRRWLAAVLATGLFTLAHLPNPLLVALTLVWGLVACVLFLRYRNLYTLGVAHAILGIAVALTAPNHIQRHMRVGIGYLHYHAGVRRPSSGVRGNASSLRPSG
jgi:membrane protease YdiL (CAAX protease family)